MSLIFKSFVFDVSNKGKKELSGSLSLGSTLIIRGPSGCGKSTFLKAVCGLISNSGSLMLDGAEQVGRSVELRRFPIAFQSPTLFPHLNVRENLELGIKLNRGSIQGQWADELEKWINALEIEDLLEKRSFQLSGGEAQRVCLGRTLVWRPRLALLDEPFSALDPERRERIRSYVLNFVHSQNLNAFLVSHHLDDTGLVGDKTLNWPESSCLNF